MIDECRPLGTTGLSLSRIGLGGAVLGNLYRPLPDQGARRTVEAALSAGINYVDTAPHYGRGLSERRIGDVVRRRQGVVVSSKVGRLMVPDASIRDDRERERFRSPMPFRTRYDYTRDGVLRSWEASLHRMGLSRIDILYIHDIGRLWHGDDHDRTWAELTRGGGLAALEELRAAGEIAAFGVGVNEIDICLDLLKETRLDVILLAGRYTLIEQRPLKTLFPACEKAGTSIVIGGPYNSGILASGTKACGTIHYDYDPAPPCVLDHVARIETIAAIYNVPLAAAALRFPLAHPQVASVIPGLGSEAEVVATEALLRAPIPAAFWDHLVAERLLHPVCPVPAGDDVVAGRATESALSSASAHR